MHAGLIAALLAVLAVAAFALLRRARARSAVERQALAQDVSARKAAEQAARLTERKFQIAFDAAPFAVVLVDGDGRILEHNRAAGAMLGYGDRLSGLSVPALCQGEHAARTARQIRALAAGERDEYAEERRMRRQDGATIDVLVRATAVRDEAGRFLYAMGVYEDLTEQYRLRERLALADRMASLGTLAAGVAHEINNPLACVIANLRWVGEELAGSASDDVRAALAEADTAADRVRRIVRDLKDLVRPDAGGEVTHDLEGVLRDAIDRAAGEVRGRARVAIAVPALPPVSGAPQRLAQLFLNLLVNAAQAIPEGGGGRHEIRVTAAADGQRVTVEISDTGAGIDPAIRDRLFDPFFTTKGAGAGPGLGLSVCHAIVARAGGSIEARCGPGGGATFRVALPVHGAVAAAAEPRASDA
jgi:PAS domain S-box-containing protein